VEKHESVAQARAHSAKKIARSDRGSSGGKLPKSKAKEQEGRGKKGTLNGTEVLPEARDDDSGTPSGAGKGIRPEVKVPKPFVDNANCRI